MSDKQRFEYILNHYSELCDEVKAYNDENLPSNKAIVIKKAIYMDLFQIGEHINKLSAKTKEHLNPNDVRGIIDVRNIIGHGYEEVDPEIIWDTIDLDCPRLIAKLQELFKLN